MDRIKNELIKMLEDNPDSDHAKKRIGSSKIEFTLQRNGIWGVESGE